MNPTAAAVPRALSALVPALALLALAGCGERAEPARAPAVADPQPVWRVAGARQVHDIGELAQALPAAAARPAADPLGRPELPEVRFAGESMAGMAALLTELGGMNVVCSPAVAAQTLDLELRRVTPRQVIDTVSRLHGLWYREDERVLRLLTAEEHLRELKVRPDERIRIIPLLNAPAHGIAGAIANLLGARIRLVTPAENSSFGFLTKEDYEAFLSSDEDEDDDDEDTDAGRTRTDGKLTDTERQQVLEQQRPAGPRVDELTSGAAAAAGVKPAGVITVLPRTNAIGIYSSDEALLRQILGVVEALDTPTAQVLLEVKVMTIKLGRDFQSFFDASFSQTTADHGGQTSTLSALNQAPLDSPTVAFRMLNRHIDLRMQLMQRDNRAESIATPLLLCASNAPASFFVGDQRAILTGITPGSTTTVEGSSPIITPATPRLDYREVGTSLDILPVINADGTVTMRFGFSFDEVVPASAPFYYIDSANQLQTVLVDTVSSSKTTTIVVAQDGQAVVLGGLIREVVQDTEDKVPFLGDLPGLGFFFRKQIKAKEKQETVIIIRPIILSNPRQAGWDTRERLRQLGDGTYWKEGRERLVEERDGRLRRLGEAEAEADPESAAPSPQPPAPSLP